MSDKREKRKSRNIPLMDYYEILQLEFLSYYFRHEFYEREQDKQKYFDFCKKKKESIEQLAFRNCFPSVFNDETYKEKYLNKFLGEKGMPNFTYRDEHQKLHLGYWDRVYFFKKGSEVLYQGNVWEVLVNLCQFDGEGGSVVIARDGKPDIKVDYRDVQRVIDREDISFDKF
jgi:uncharacterized LabA/DUF88 family protein